MVKLHKDENENNEETGPWLLYVESEYGGDYYGPFFDAVRVEQARERIKNKAEELDDGIDRRYVIINISREEQ